MDGHLGINLDISKGMKTLFPLAVSPESLWKSTQQFKIHFLGSNCGDAPHRPQNTHVLPHWAIEDGLHCFNTHKGRWDIFGWLHLAWNWWSCGHFCDCSCWRPAIFWEPPGQLNFHPCKVFWAQPICSMLLIRYKIIQICFYLTQIDPKSTEIWHISAICSCCTVCSQQLWCPLHVLHPYYFVDAVWYSIVLKHADLLLLALFPFRWCSSGSFCILHGLKLQSCHQIHTP